MFFDAYYSDPHHGHTRIIEYCNRPFRDSAHMTEELVRRYNDVVGPNDTVLWLGDCFFVHFPTAREIVSRLNGYKVILRGNHDKRYKDAAFRALGFLDVYPSYFKSEVAEFPVYYSHYPFAGYSLDARYNNRRPPDDDRVIIHGHTHEASRLTSKNTVHVGVDAWNFAPARREDVELLVKEAYERKCNVR